MGLKGRLLGAVLALGACLAWAALGAGPAAAGLFHPKPAACAFGSGGSSASSFEGALNRIALQQAEAKLYATNHSGGNPGHVAGFDASTACPAGESGGYPALAGFPLTTPEMPSEPGIAVDNTSLPSKGNIYVAEGKTLLGFDRGGDKLFEATVTDAVALWSAVGVDPDGEVWADENRGHINRVRELSPSGAELQTIDLSESPAIAGVSNGFSSLDFDAAGDLFVGSGGGAWKLAAPDYGGAVEIDPKPTGAITLDRSTGDLYVAEEKAIARYGPDGQLIERFPAAPLGGPLQGLAVDEQSKVVYAYDKGGKQVRVFKALVLPDLATGPLSGLAETSATLNGTVGPDGVALSACKLEWVSEAAFLATGFTDLSSGGEHECEPAFGSIPTSGETPVSAPASGLSPATRYRFRVSASNENGTNSSASVSFELAKPGVETVGSPLRTTTTARLDSRVDPHGIPTTYRFEYLTEAAYEANLAASEPPFAGATATSDLSAGSGGLIRLASAQVAELQPNTTYRYRVIAENAAFGEAFGEARSLLTRESGAPLSHGAFPGPPGSDRAWEQVNLPDTSGNPVSLAGGIAADGDSALYRVLGGTHVSPAGTLFDYLFARRPAGEHPSEGWQTVPVYPPRAETAFAAWLPPAGTASLSSLVAVNLDLEEGSGAAVWKIPTEGGSPTKLFEAGSKQYGGLYLASEDGSRALALLVGSLDPEHPSPPNIRQLYDLSSGSPRLAGLLPGNTVPSCGTTPGTGLFDVPGKWVARSTHWVSADGSRLFFPNSCSGTAHLFMRDLVAEETVRVDGPPLSGPDCPGAMIRSTPASLYLWTQSRLATEDGAVGACGGGGEFGAAGGDVYRYDLTAHEFECLTCVAPGGLAANVNPGAGAEGAAHAIAVAPAGGRLYFTTRSHLLPGAAEAGTPAIYRVDTETHELAYVGPLEVGGNVGENPRGFFDGEGTAISPDGRYLAFRSAAAGLDSLTGSANGGFAQDYLYDDAERSLACASCPADGSPPRGAVAKGILGEAEPGPNMTSVSDGGDFAFSTPTALVAADQNTAGPGEAAEAGSDVYEWRDGRVLLVSDGLSSWPKGAAPQVASIDPSGRDVFFTEAAQLTPDALDNYKRLYDARIGGGIEFPPSSEPCALEVCQGTPKGAPEESPPGSAGFAGAGDEEAPAAHKKKKHKKKRHSKAKKHHKRVRHERNKGKKHHHRGKK